MKIRKTLLYISTAALLLFAPGCDRTQSGSPAATTSTAAVESATTTIREYAPSDFFVYDPDTLMRYLGTGNEFAEFSSYVEYIKDDVIQIRYVNPGTSAVSVYKITQDAVTRIFFQGEIYYRHDFTKFDGSEEIIIKAPVETGTSWELRDGSVRTITAVGVEIKTAAGTFYAIEVTTKTASSTLKDYYAKDAGLVKRVFTSDEAPGEEIISELLDIEADVPFTQEFTVWYPSLDNDDYIPLDRTLSLWTDDDILKELETAMKTGHEQLSLPTLIPQSASINHIDPSFTRDLLSADFSSEFISDLNAGAYYESMILYATAKTLGGYYQYSRVMITIDGKPYSSGHIAFEEGEYIQIVDQIH